ncbi:MotA/TolQ/ExbB proton channel family protein [bacterium]|jgi:biopolymer transport protein ExbB|nr:MotA/TolQ/ExbB proton channel family protein [bacterium]
MIIDFIQKGGIVMYPLFFVAVLAFYLLIYKAIELGRLALHYKKHQIIFQVRDLLKENKIPEAIKLLKYDGPTEKILAKGIHYLQEKYSEDAIKDRLEMIYEEETHQLEKRLPLILVLGEIMPMLGLLGTVSGMINVFRAISAYGTSDAAALASGISEALLTTEVGLVLAIPTLFFYTVLNSQVENITKLMRHAGFAIVTISRVINKQK